MRLEFVIYPLLFILIGLMFVSFFLVWQWFDARDRVQIVREITREKTIQDIRRSHNKCRLLLAIGMFLALCYVPFPFFKTDFLGTLVYPGVVLLADILILVGMRIRAKQFIDSMDYYVNINEEHVREAAAERARQREEWRRQAPELNPQTAAYIKETLGDNYETWYPHDILLSRNVLANVDEGLLFAQGVVLPFREIMEVRQGRKDLKLVTSNSMYPFITIDFGTLPINPVTGGKYKDELAALIERQMP